MPNFSRFTVPTHLEPTADELDRRFYGRGEDTPDDEPRRMPAKFLTVKIIEPKIKEPNV